MIAAANAKKMTLPVPMKIQKTNATDEANLSYFQKKIGQLTNAFNGDYLIPGIDQSHVHDVILPL